jgi:hypothetical protein
MTMIRSALVASLFVAACTSNNGNAPTSLVRVDDEPAGSNCKNGGVAISTGHDTNDDGVLGDDEIVTTQYVCNGASVVRCHGGTVHSGSVVIRDPADFDQLAGVACVDGDLIIAGIPGDIPSLPELHTVTGGVTVAGNPDLTSLAGLGGVREIGQSYLIQGNDSLGDIAQLASLDTVLSIFIVGNDGLQNLAGFSSLHQLNTKLTVANNPNLSSLQGLDNVVTATSWLVVRSNRSLTDVSALQGLRAVGAMEVSGNQSLTALSLPSLEKVDVRLTVNSNPQLAALSVPKLATLSDGITIIGNPQLASIDLHSLLTTGTVTIDQNTSLTTINASSFSYATVDLVIANMSTLQTANFSSLNAVGGTLKFVNVSPLSFSGFGQLESVGNLWLSGSGNTDFSGFVSLNNVGADMTVLGNPNLSSFNGLDQMTTVGGNLLISNNPSLSSGAAQAFANDVSVGGTTTIN